MGAVELEPRPKEPGKRAYEAFLKAFEAGVLIRYTGDILAFSPPLIVEDAQVDRIFETVRAALGATE
jgi:beta-alanine--pyruvate transaminase